MSLIQQPTPTLKLPKPNYVTAFRMIDQQLRADARVRSVIKPGSFMSWTGDPDELRGVPGLDQLPFMRLNPMIGPAPFSANDSFLAQLAIQIELYTAGTCWDDLACLWDVVRGAIYLRDTTTPNFVTRLQTAASLLNLPSFGTFQSDPSPGEDGAWRGVGSLNMTVRISAIP